MSKAKILAIASVANLSLTARAGDSPYYWQQLQMNAAHNVTTGSSAISVAILSNGVDYRIEAFNQNIARNQGEAHYGHDSDGIDNDKNGFVDDYWGVNLLSGNGDVLQSDPAFSAGTSAASIVHTFAPASRFIPIKVYEDIGRNLANIDTIAKGIDYAAARGAKIILWDAGASEEDRDLACRAIQRAAKKNILIVAHSGELGRELSSFEFPGGCDAANLVVVAASDASGTLAPFASYSSRWVHIAAPGVAIPAFKAGGKNSLFSGGLASAAITAAVASLVWSVEPELSAHTVKRRVVNGIDIVEDLEEKVLSQGRLNALKSLTRKQ